MASGKVLFLGDSDIDQIHQIFSIFGTPDKTLSIKFNDLSNGTIELPQYQAKDLSSLISNDDLVFVDLLRKMLQIDPISRITAKKALKHPYFDLIHEQIKEKYI
jgi:serine/threonine protein kinase